MNAERLLEHYEKIADAPDAIARLRRFILNLAVRGKLVPQDAADEPATELVKAIDANRRLTAGKARDDIAPKSAPFALPRGWAWSTLGSICSKTGSGSTPRGGKEVYVDDGIPFLRSQNVYDDGLRLSDVANIAPEVHQRMAGTAVRGSDLLLNITGGSMGRCCRVPDQFGEANISQHVAIIRPAIASMSRYLHALVMSPYFQAFIFDEQTGAGRGGLPKNRMDQITVALPPLAEQHRIVAKVDELMALCDQLEAARAAREATRDRLAAASLARLNTPDPETFPEDARFALDALPALTTRPDQIKQLRQTILNLAVRGKLVPQDPQDEPANVKMAEDPDHDKSRLDSELPSAWRWVRVENVADARLGKMLDKAKNAGRPYRYLRNTNVHWFDIRLDDLKSIPLSVAELDEYRLLKGDVLICEGGHGIGRTAVWRSDLQEVVFQKALHRVRPGPNLHPDFFAHCCFVYYEAGIMQTYFTGVGIPHFTGRALSKLVFPLPPLAEQHRIVAKVHQVMALCDRLESSMSTADETRRKLLNALLAEALTPTDVDDLQEAAE
jgi:type I restriction enzyme S subunit